MECAHSWIQGKNISNGFWEEAINTVVYLKNRSPTKKLAFQTPFEILYGHKPGVNHLRGFGCTAIAHIPKDNRRKLDAKSIKCVFISIVQIRKHINCLILIHINCLQVEMWCFMRMLIKVIQ